MPCANNEDYRGLMFSRAKENHIAAGQGSEMGDYTFLRSFPSPLLLGYHGAQIFSSDAGKRMKSSLTICSQSRFLVTS